MNNCIFCKIIANEAPSFKIYEDDSVIAILDHRPVREGAAMVIPKEHCEHFINLSNDLAAHIVKIGNKIGRKMQIVFKPKRIGFAVAGFGVPHVHYHVIPMHHEHDVTSGAYVRCENGQLVFDMENTPLANNETQRKNLKLLQLTGKF